MQEYTITPITGLGTGYLYSSYSQIDPLYESHGFGQAKIRSWINLTNGNAVLESFPLTIKEAVGEIPLCFYYNSLPDKWQFSIKSLLKITKGQFIQLQDEEGSLITYTFDAKSQRYIAPGFSDEIPWIIFDNTQQQWCHVYPKTGRKYYFSQNGLLQSMQDRFGNALYYFYDSQNRLIKIRSYYDYKIDWTDLNNITLTQVDPSNQNSILMMTWAFQNGKLTQTQTPDNYVINYQYSNGYLTVTQSDQTQFNFNFTNNGSMTSLLLGNLTGGNQAQYYFGIDAKKPYVTNPLGIRINLECDAAGRVVKKTEERGYPRDLKKPEDITQYFYTSGQLTQTIYPDGSCLVNEYVSENNNVDNQGLLLKQTLPNGIVIQNFYQTNSNCLTPFLVATQKTGNDNQSKQATYYIYDEEKLKKTGELFLRFVISPCGTVTEYREFATGIYGLVATKRTYCVNYCDTSLFTPNNPPSYTSMQQWVSVQDPTQVFLEENCVFDARGRVLQTRSYVAIDQNGNGIPNNLMSQDNCSWSLYSQVQHHRKLYSLNQFTSVQFEWDGLFRERKKIEQIDDNHEAVTEQVYQDSAQCMTQIDPNGKRTQIQWDVLSAINGKTEIVQNGVSEEKRITTYTNDKTNAPVMILKPDGQKEVQFFDNQNRLGFTVSSAGQVVQYVYDRQNNYEQKISYDETIDFNQIINVLKQYDPKLLDQLMLKIENPKSDRTATTIYNEMHKPIYKIETVYDPKQDLYLYYIKDYKYDALGRKISKIKYANPISQTEYNQLLNKQTITLNYDPNIDRQQRYFYNNDDQLIAEQDAAGYLTEYVLDAGGRKIQTIHYAPKLSCTDTLKTMKAILGQRTPEQKAEDDYYYHYYDSKNQLIFEIDPENYLTQFEYHSYNKIKKQTRYATKLTQIPQKNDVPTPPNSNSEDQTIEYKYDLLLRETEMFCSNGLFRTKKYDVNGSVIFQQDSDQKNPTETSANFCKRTESRFDGWLQNYQSANLFLGQELIKIDADPNLTIEEKQAKKELLWLQNSTKTVYDSTGLKLKTIDSYGAETLYYYDIQRRPIFSIDPTGIITQTVYNNFNETITTLLFANRLSDQMRQQLKLTGGFITDVIIVALNNLRDIKKDRITVYNRNQRGLIISQLDPEGFVSNFTYNAFKQRETESIPVLDQSQTVIITHQYEPRGLEVQLKKSTSDITIIQSTEYEHWRGKKTTTIDALGQRNEYRYDGLGRLIQWINAKGIKRFTKKFDAFDRVIFFIDSLGNVIQHIYNQQERTHKKIFPTPNLIETETFDVFQNAIVLSNLLNQKKQFEHTPDRLWKRQTNPLLQSTQTEFNLLGLKEKITLANGSVQQKIYNPSQQLICEIADANSSTKTDGLVLTTRYEPNVFGDVELTIQANDVKIKSQFNRLGSNIETIQDADGLALTTEKRFNALQSLIEEVKIDYKRYRVYKVQYLKDSMNRDVGQIIDPDLLALKTEKKLNLVGKVIAEITPNGGITRTFYDEVNQKRFQVGSKGEVTEWNYNSEELPYYERYYVNRINPNSLNDQTDINTLISMLHPFKQDKMLYHFYNAANLERFKVNSQGAVTEIRYDSAKNPIQTIQYGEAIDPKLLPTLDTDSLIDLVNHLDHTQSRITYRVFDGVKQERFIFDAEGYVIEKRYDASGHVIMQYQFATRVVDPTQYTELPIEQIFTALPKDPFNDRIDYRFYDALNRCDHTLRVTRLNEGIVTRFEYDKVGNQVQSVVFSQTIQISDLHDHPMLHTLSRSLIPNQNNDRIDKTTYDNVNRKLTETDALNYQKKYEWDDLGNLISETNENNAIWEYNYDNAKRRIQEIAPSTDIAVVSQVNQETRNCLSLQIQKNQNVKKTKEFDNASNVIKITQGSTLTNAKAEDLSRSVLINYNLNNQMIGNQINQVAIDDPTQAAQFNQRPEKTKNISTKINYDALKRKISECNYKNQWTFYVYDSEDREVYRVLPNRAVIETQYNIFGDIISQTKYDTQFNGDLTNYQEEGIPFNLINKALEKNDEKDRTIYFARDKRGLMKEKVFSTTFYYLHNAQDAQYGFYDPKTIFLYNAFKEEIYRADIYDPSNPDNLIWSRTLTWYDQQGNPIAVCDPLDYVTRMNYDAFGKEIKRNEWATPVAIHPTKSTTIEELDAAYQSNPKDRSFRFSYDLKNQKIQEKRLNYIAQAITFDDLGLPMMMNLSPKGIIKSFQYDGVGNTTVETNENGFSVLKQYNSHNKLIAETGIPRKNLQGMTLTPFKNFYYDAFDMQVGSTQFANGNSLKCDPEKDQTMLQLMNKRGVTIVHQNQEYYPKFITYDEENKIAREYGPLTNQTKQGSTQHLDEIRFKRDELDQPVCTTQLRDNQVKRTTKAQYNTFGEMIAEGDEENFYLFKSYDRLGNVWKTNQNKNVYTIEINDLQKRSTLSLKSATQDLSKITYGKIPDLLKNSNYQNLEQIKSERDLKGRITKKYLPEYKDHQGPTNIPLNMYVGKAYPDFGTVSLVWLAIQETNVIPTFTIWQVGSTDIRLLNIQTKNNLMGVDLSQTGLPSGKYEYKITYQLNSSFKKLIDQPFVYESQGFIQFDSGINEGSLHLVPIVEQDNQLRLVGNITNLTHVKVWQGENNLIAELPVIFNSSHQAYYADLSQLASGTYTISAVRSTSLQETLSLPFTIYTNTFSHTPLARQVDMNLAIKWLDNHVEVDWQTTKVFSQNKIAFACVYIDTNNLVRVQQAVLTPGVYIQDYEDADHHVLHCNIEFEYPVARIYTMNALIVLDEYNTQLPVFTNSKPLPTQNKMQANLIQSVGFKPQNIMWITPIANVDQYFENHHHDPFVTIIDTSLDAQATEKLLTIKGVVKSVAESKIPQGIVLDTDELAFGQYPYTIFPVKKQKAMELRIDEKDASIIRGRFAKAYDGVIYRGQEHLPNSQEQQFTPLYQYKYDRWDNQIEVTNSLGYVTQQEYNDRDQLIKTILPAVEVGDDHGNISLQNPIVTAGYNATGNKVGETDANKHTEAYTLDEADQMIKHYLPSGMLESEHDLDIFGNRIGTIDDQKQKWCMSYNRGNRLLKLTTPEGRDSQYDYDERWNRNKHVFPSGATYYYLHDPFDNVSDTILPLGEIQTRVNDRNHQLIEYIDPTGTLKWNREYFGNLVDASVGEGHIDLSGAKYYYRHNLKQQVVQEYSSGGAHGSSFTPYPWVYNEGIPTPQYNFSTSATPAKNLYFIYRNDWLVGVNDYAMNRFTTYTTDSEGQRTSVKMTHQYGGVIRHAETQYDAIGRPTFVYDNQMTTSILYDINSNRRKIESEVVASNGTKTSHNSWFNYDLDNRVTIYDGVLSNGVITKTLDQGTLYAYTGNLRKQSIAGSVTYNYIYDKDSRLKMTRDNTNAIKQQYKWELDDWVSCYEDSETGLKETTNYDENGYQISSIVEGANLNSTTTFNYSNLRLDKQVTTYIAPAIFTDTFTYKYVYFETPLINSVSFTRSGKYSDSSVSGLYYTANGHWQAVQRFPYNATKVDNYMETSYDGTIMTNSTFWDSYLNSLNRLFSDVNGNLYGDMNTDLNLEKSFIHHAHRYTRAVANDTKAGINRLFVRREGNYWVSYRQDPKKTTNQYNILSNYLRPNAEGLPRGPQRHTIQNNETLENLSQRYTGDSGTSAKLALATGSNPQDALMPGNVMSIPALFPTHNNFTNHRNFNELVSIFIGALPAEIGPHILKKEHHHGGFLKKLLVVVVGAVIGFIAPPLLMEALAISSQALAMAIGAALASAASQGVAMAFGMQQRFSWQSMLEAAFEAYVYAQIGPKLPEGKGLQELSLSEQKGYFLEAVQAHGIVKASEMLIEMSVGARKQFDVNEVLAYAVNSTLNEAAKLSGNQFVAQQVSSVISAGVNKILLNQPISLESIEVQALGNYIGQKINDEIKDPLFNYLQEQKQKRILETIAPGSQKIKIGNQMYAVDEKGEVLIGIEENAEEMIIPNQKKSSLQRHGFFKAKENPAMYQHEKQTQKNTYDVAEMMEGSRTDGAEGVFSDMVQQASIAPKKSNFMDIVDFVNDMHSGTQEGFKSSVSLGFWGADYSQQTNTAQKIGYRIGEIEGFVGGLIIGTSEIRIGATLVQIGNAAVSATKNAVGFFSKLSLPSKNIRVKIISDVSSGLSKNNVTFELAPRVEKQLQDSRLGSLTGKLNVKSLNSLANNPEAQFLYDTGTGHINVIQTLEGKLLRITVPRDSFKIISVGPIQQRNIINSINNGRYLPIADNKLMLEYSHSILEVQP